jgi:hypothetical protein
MISRGLMTMCRATYEGGRRCPGCSDPGRRALARIRQRIGRYDRAARRANTAGDWAKVERYAALLDRDVAAYETATSPPAAAPASRAGEFTPAATVDLADEQLLAAYGELGQDPAAQDQIIATLEWRDEQAQLRDREIAEHREQQQREQAAAWAAAVADPNDASPLTNPARRGAGLRAGAGADPADGATRRDRAAAAAGRQPRPRRRRPRGVQTVPPRRA